MTSESASGSTGRLVAVAAIAAAVALGWWSLAGQTTADGSAEVRTSADTASPDVASTQQPDTFDTGSAKSDTGRETLAPSTDSATEATSQDTSDGSLARSDTAPKPPPLATGDRFERGLASLKVRPDSDLRLNVRAKTLHEHSPCDRGDNIEFHLERGDDRLDLKVLHGDCRGACSPEEKREGREHLERLKRRIDAGKADPSRLDYNFTDCIGLEHQLAHTFEAPTPPLAVVVSEQLGPHDTVEKYARLVTVGCDDVQMSPDLDNPTWPNHAQTFSRMTVDATREGSTRHYEIALRNGHVDRLADGGYPMTARIDVTFDESTCEWTVP